MKPEHYILKLLDEIPLMQLATSEDDQPWVVNVYFAADNQHNLYWISRNTRRHSKEIHNNSHVAATIHRPAVVGQPGQAVSVEGRAHLVPSEDVEELFQAYAERFGKHDLLPQLLDQDNPYSLYQLAPLSFILFDELNYPDDPRQPWVPQTVVAE